jgi:hypothetical protein
VTAGAPLPLGLNFAPLGDQRFDIHECTVLGTTIALVAEGSRLKLPRPDISGCDQTRVVLSVEPGQTVDWPVPQLYADGVPTREIRSGPTGSYLGGTLTPGEYRWVVSLALRSGINGLNSRVTITAHPCGGFTTELVDRFVGSTADEAATEAASTGLSTRVVELDGEELASTDDLRCDRVNLAVADGTVVAVADVG